MAPEFTICRERDRLLRRAVEATNAHSATVSNLLMYIANGQRLALEETIARVQETSRLTVEAWHEYCAHTKTHHC